MSQKVWVGVDVGSVSINIAVVNRRREVIKDYYIRVEGEPNVITGWGPSSPPLPISQVWE